MTCPRNQPAHRMPRIIRGPQLPETPISKKPIGPATSTDDVHIKLHRDGDAIRLIEIRCACGETIQIQCEYE